MKQEILINVTPRTTRVALVVAGALQELYVEHTNKLSLVGNIYKGKIVRILPGMQAAFVDIGQDGLEHNGFLPLEEVAQQIQPGQEILVQVIKDSINSTINPKGVRLTTRLSIASRLLVYFPGLDTINVSAKITDPLEQTRLKNLLIKENVTGFMIRSAAVGAKSLATDKIYLLKVWKRVSSCSKQAQTGDLLYQNLPLTLRILRDVVSNKVQIIRIDDPQQLLIIREFLKDYFAHFTGIIELYSAEQPIFKLYNIDAEIDSLLRRRIPLKSGGYLIIDQTEALTTIDVNTGSFVGNKNLEATAYHTNLEAISVIGKQIRLRNLGGMIIVDFIDMLKESHRSEVIYALEKTLALDRVQTSCSDFSAQGLVTITRKRTRASLQHLLCEQCPTCVGSGYVKSAVAL